jgi:hypothetical protein
MSDGITDSSRGRKVYVWVNAGLSRFEPFDVCDLVRSAIRWQWASRWEVRHDRSEFSIRQRQRDVAWLRGAVRWLREQEAKHAVGERGAL